MKANFRNIFGVLSVSSATLAVAVGIFTLVTIHTKNSSSFTPMLMMIASLPVFSLAGFCASLVKERYQILSYTGMIVSMVAFVVMASFMLYVQSMFAYSNTPEETVYPGHISYTLQEILGKATFFLASSSFVLGYISLLLTTLRGYACLLNNFIWTTIGLLCTMWTITQVLMISDGRIMQDIYPLVGTVYMLSLLGGVWIFVLSRMGVAEPKKYADVLFNKGE